MLAVAGINSSNQTMASATYDRYGIPQSGSKEEVRKIARFSDDFYFNWNKLGFVNGQKGIGLGAVLALFEMVTAWALIKLERSPATFANAFTTFSECLQVLISGYEMTKINPSKIDDEKEKSEAEMKLKRRENFRGIGMACVIAGAGSGGMWKFIKEYFLKEDHQDLHQLPVWQKAALSTASLISSAGMGMGYGEKSLMAALARSENGGVKSEQMILNARSDGRCSLEWLTMSLFPWVVGFKPAKFLIDLAIPLSALQDSISHLLEPILKNRGVHSHISQAVDGDHLKEKKSSWDLFKELFWKIFTHQHLIKIPSGYFKSLILGGGNSQGLRSLLFKPLFKVFGCKPPDCYLSKNNKLVVSIPVQSDDSNMPEKDFVTVVPNQMQHINRPKEKIASLS